MLFDFSITGTPLLRTDRHRLAVIVTINDVPASRLVVVIDRLTFTLIAATYSSTDGTWEIYGIPEYPEKQLLVISLDHTAYFNAKVFDYESQV